MREFAFRLCLAIGCPHPDLLPLTAGQLWDWFIYYAEEPFGDTRDDLRQIAALGVQLGIDDMRLTWPYREELPSRDELKEEIEQLERLTGAKS